MLPGTEILIPKSIPKLDRRCKARPIKQTLEFGKEKPLQKLEDSTHSVHQHDIVET
jgi:hypothetical protein